MSSEYIKVLMIDGRTLSVLPNLVPKTLIHRYSIVAILITFALLFILKPYEYLSLQPVWFSAPFLLTSVIAMLLLITAMLVGSGMYFRPRRIITFPSSVTSTVLVMFVTDHLLYMIIRDPLMSAFIFILKCIFTGIFAEVVMFFYFNYIYPKVVEENTIIASPEPQIERAFEARFIDAGGTPVLLTDVMYIEAQQSYVSIVTPDRSFLVRRTFCDCVSDMPADIGKQVHRSFWVSKAYVSHVQRLTQYRTQIVLKNGAKIPMSRTRASEIEKWIAGLLK